jgi:hypothetical protein
MSGRYTPPDRETAKRLIDLGRGVQVEHDVLGVVEQIRKRWPVLDVQFLDPGRFEEITDAPYRIIEHCADGFDRVVFSTWTLDGRIYERIYNADTLRGSILERIDANNNHLRAGERQRFQERLAEAADIAKHVLQNPRTSYSFENTDGEKITVQDDKGVVKRDRR